MTIVIRRIGPTRLWNLRKCGLCRIGLDEVVGVFPSKERKVVWIGSTD